MAQAGGAAIRDGLAASSGSGSGSGSSHCTSDCISAVGSPERSSSPLLRRSPEKRRSPSEPLPAGRPVSPGQLSSAERRLLRQNRLLKSSLIRALEKLQLQMEDSSRVRRLLIRLLRLRSTAPQPAGSSSAEAVAPADLYSRYEALVKQNYQLEQALLQSGGQPGAAHHELDEYKAVAKMQMAAMQQDWRDEREEKERALALNAQLHQQVEQLQHQLEQLQQARQPRSEPFETLEPSQLTGSSSWSPEPARQLQPRRMLPPPGYTQTARGVWPTPRAERELRTRGLGPARSVEEVLTAPYDALRLEPPAPPAERRPPAEADLRRPLLARDSGYSDLLAGGQEAGDGELAAPLLSQLSADTGTEEDWTQLESEGAGNDITYRGICPHTAHQATDTARQATDTARRATDTGHQVSCPYCGVVFAADEHLVYMDHVEECPARGRRRTPR